MKQHKIINLNLKLKLSRKPSEKEKDLLASAISNMLDADHYGRLYDLSIGDEKSKTTFEVENHKVSVRKMGGYI